MNVLQTTTLAAQTIVTPLAVATYTALADHELLAHVYLSGIVGNGNYRALLTKQRGGAGSVFQGATAAIPVASGTTTCWLETLPLPVVAGDVVTVWVQGLAGDVSVGVVTDVFDLAAPTASDNATAAAAAILVTPAHKLATDAGGTITTVTNLTNAPTAGDLTETMKNSVFDQAESAVLALLTDGITTLADGAITATKFDGSTAFPVTSADTGGTRIARTGADGDTLKSLSDQSDTIAARLGAWTGTGVNTLLGAFQALFRKDASAPSDIGGTFDPVADSTEAISEAVAAGGASIDPQDIANAALLAPVGVAAAGSQMDYLADMPANVDAQLSGTHGAGGWEGGAGGVGTVPFQYLVNDIANNPIADVRVVVTTDLAGLNIYDEQHTNAFGIAPFHLVPGTWYFWPHRVGYTYDDGTLPDIEVVA